MLFFLWFEARWRLNATSKYAGAIKASVKSGYNTAYLVEN
jgi:hypothetical protein